MSTRMRNSLAIDFWKVGSPAEEEDGSINFARNKAGALRISLQAAEGREPDICLGIPAEDIPTLVAFLTKEFGL